MALVTTDIIRILQLFNEKQWEEEKNICMMGKQFIWIDWKKFMVIVDQFGFRYKKEVYEKIREIYPIDAYQFFQMFGFSEVRAIDISTYEDADILFDLNMDGDLPEYLHEKFDLVIDGGTLEHVFNIHNAIKNMSGMVRINGYIFHGVPLAGYVDHGFYSISPTFFLDFYGSDFKVIDLNMKFWVSNGVNYEHELWGETFSQDCRLFYDRIEINKYINKVSAVSEIKETLLICIAHKKRKVENTCPVQGAVMKVHESVKQSVPARKLSYTDILNLFRVIGGGIVLFGAGRDCELLLNELYKNDMEDFVEYIFDTNIDRAGSKYRGFDVLYPTKKKLEKVNTIFISSTKFEEEIYSFLLDLEIKETNIYKITNYMI